MLKARTHIGLLFAHILIGMVIFVLPFLANLYELSIIILSLFFIIKNKNRNEEILIAGAYIAGSDVFLRMTGGTLTSETHKYMLIVFILIGIFFKNATTKGYIYLIYILLLIPGIIVIDYFLDQEIRKLIAFNLGGPVCLGIVSFYLYRRKISFQKMNTILFTMALPIVSMTTYVVLYNPSIREKITNTASNFDTSGGYGPNQVSTILGVGIFIFVAQIILNKKSKLLTFINVALLAIVTFRALVTFSRGGVFTGAFAVILLVFIVFFYGNLKIKFRMAKYIFAGIFIFGAIWAFTSFTTGGIIDKRYNNEDAAGRKKKDLTTGRGTLFNLEIEAFLDNPIFGIGVGNAKKYRFERSGVTAASHNEFSRTLAEHGSLGLLGLIILVFNPLINRFTHRSNPYFYSLFVIWFLTLSHSATRIAAPSLIYGLALVDIYYENNNLRRKQVIE